MAAFIRKSQNLDIDFSHFSQPSRNKIVSRFEATPSESQSSEQIDGGQIDGHTQMFIIAPVPEMKFSFCLSLHQFQLFSASFK